MTTLVRRFGLVCLLALFFAGPADGADTGLTPVPAAELSRDLREGKPVVRRRLSVEGPLVLTGTDSVRALFRCRDCTFRGRVAAPDVTFERRVDLSGSTFEAGVVFRGATFRAPALFRPTRDQEVSGPRGGMSGKPFVFKGIADFSLAVFEDFATFGDSMFSGDAVFRHARFTDVTFSRARFIRGATFTQASFRGAALFNGTTFSRAATFEDADFRSRTTFSLASFLGGATFTGAQLAGGAAFLRTTFGMNAQSKTAGPEEPVAARFQNVSSAGDLDFTYADFQRGQLPEGARIALFEDVVCSGSVVFRRATFAEAPIGVTRLQARDLVLDVDVVEQIDLEDDQRDALERIEESAKARGDLEVANDARYELRVKRSADYSDVGQVLDYVFYRGVAGYLVRPSHPLAALLGLATIMAVIRARKLPRNPGGGRRRRLPRRGWRRVKGGCSDFLTCFLDAVGRAGPRFGGAAVTETPLPERLERLTYRLLGVCALIALANSNPTLRQMVDTLF